MTSLASFTKLEKVGRGSYGDVWKAKRNADGAIVALKEMSMVGIGKDEEKELLNETKCMLQVQHPHVIQLRSFFMENQMLYIIMEYACGGDLSGAIKRHIAAGTHFPEEKLWSFLIQMTQGLQHLHSRRILHRDIKPQNVFLNVAQSGETEIKIGDLGLGKIMTASDRCAVSQVGTPLYFSPEICQGRPYDQKSDVWGMGCLMHELAALRPPFHAQNQLLLAQKIIRDPPDSKVPSLYSKEMHFIIHKLLDKDPRRRPSPDSILAYSAVQIRVERALFAARESELCGLVEELRAKVSASSTERAAVLLHTADRCRGEVEAERAARRTAERRADAAEVRAVAAEARAAAAEAQAERAGTALRAAESSVANTAKELEMAQGEVSALRRKLETASVADCRRGEGEMHGDGGAKEHLTEAEEVTRLRHDSVLRNLRNQELQTRACGDQSGMEERLLPSVPATDTPNLRPEESMTTCVSNTKQSSESALTPRCCKYAETPNASDRCTSREVPGAPVALPSSWELSADVEQAHSPSDGTRVGRPSVCGSPCRFIYETVPANLFSSPLSMRKSGEERCREEAPGSLGRRPAALGRTSPRQLLEMQSPSDGEESFRSCSPRVGGGRHGAGAIWARRDSSPPTGPCGRYGAVQLSSRALEHRVAPRHSWDPAGGKTWWSPRASCLSVAAAGAGCEVGSTGVHTRLGLAGCGPRRGSRLARASLEGLDTKTPSAMFAGTSLSSASKTDDAGHGRQASLGQECTPTAVMRLHECGVRSSGVTRADNVEVSAGEMRRHAKTHAENKCIVPTSPTRNVETDESRPVKSDDEGGNIAARGGQAREDTAHAAASQVEYVLELTKRMRESAQRALSDSSDCASNSASNPGSPQDSATATVSMPHDSRRRLQL